MCWSCGARIAPKEAEAESVIQARAARDGGPFRTFSCPSCRIRCGALRNRRGAWLLYPLEGGDEPTLLDRLVPRTSRAQLAKARRWWLENGLRVERFRREPADAMADEEPVRPPPRAERPRAAARPAAAPRATGPRAVLGVAADATLADIRRAWRAAARRWHPDRIPTTDVVVLAEAQRRFLEMRAAYDALVAELSDGRGRVR